MCGAERSIPEIIPVGGLRGVRIFSTISEDDPLDLNTANAGELQQLEGIGPELAERISAAQPFEKVTDLLKVQSIAEGKLEKIAPFLKIGEGGK